MIENTYILSLLILAVALFVLGLLYLFLNTSDNPKLAAYRKASKAMAFTYLFFSLVNVFESLERFTSEISGNALLLKMVTLIIASPQALCFTFAMVSLVNTQYITQKRFWREIFIISSFIVAGLAIYFGMNNAVTNVYLYVLTAFYFSQLIRYTLIFRKLYSQCLLEIENYFSGQEEERLRWINFSFFSALTVGLMALIFTFFPFALFGTACSVACLVFYVYFAIRFVNYTFVFNIIEEVISKKQEVENDDSLPEPVVNKSVAALESRINQWIADKQYCQPGVTIKDLAGYLGTNIKYLSLYINNYEGKTFRNWINDLRIKEARRLMQENLSCKLDTIAQSVGYANKSAFLNQFTKQINMSPSEWKKRL